jgi:uncharacterized membrane protein YbhN (UPF0104 family)
LPEIVVDGEDGALVPPGDANALAGALARLPLPPPTGRALQRHRPDVVAADHALAYEAALVEPVPRWHVARWAGALFGLIVLAALVVRLAHDWSAVQRAWSDARPGPIVVALAAMLVAEAGFAAASAISLRALGEDVPVSRGAAAFLVGQTARHLPGAIWAPLARAGIARRWGVGSRRVLAWLAVEATASVAAGSVVGCTLLAAAGLAGVDVRLPPWLWAVGACVALTLPVIVARLSRTGELPRRLMGLLPPARVLYVTSAAYLVVWLLDVLAFAALAAALVHLDLAEAIACGAGAAIALIAGFLAVPVPAGIGIREAVLVFFLAPFMPTPIALSVALGARVLATVVQSGLALISLPVLKSRPAADAPAR